MHIKMKTVKRRTVLSSSAVLVTVGAAGCSGEEQPTGGVGIQSPDNTLTLTSSAFGDDKQLPTRYEDETGTLNPSLTITNVHNSTKSLALIVDDPDAVKPARNVWDHWIARSIPPDQGSIPAG
jgi:phosphatidylethanolamine-binding protein (PEBP) family uncharacterized protein